MRSTLNSYVLFFNNNSSRKKTKRYQTKSRIVRDAKTFMKRGKFYSYHIPDGEETIVEEISDNEYGATFARSIKLSGSTQASRDRVVTNASIFGAIYPKNNNSQQQEEQQQRGDNNKQAMNTVDDPEDEFMEDNPDYKYFASPI